MLKHIKDRIARTGQDPEAEVHHTNSDFAAIGSHDDIDSFAYRGESDSVVKQVAKRLGQPKSIAIQYDFVGWYVEVELQSPVACLPSGAFHCKCHDFACRHDLNVQQDLTGGNIGGIHKIVYHAGQQPDLTVNRISA
ncbi:hypothetical protein WL27_22960 [Burkholderia multivorans]|nr:hypothetical protein WL27_22960 [Burkholderia multivorans]